MASAQDETAKTQEAVEPSATVYVKNLEEKLKIPALVESLREVFSEYGTIVDIIAKKSIKRKGQAFIVFESVESAEAAIGDLDGFEFAGKEMSCQFAKTKSDATVKREGTAEEFEDHKRIRQEAKERKQAAEAEQEKKKKRPAADAPASNRNKAARTVPIDDKVAPSTVLMVQGIPDDYDENAMSALFSRYSTFKEYHSVPFRKGLGFAHFETVEGASAARVALGSISLGESPLTITFRAA